ncbi:hypothetical protein JTE90_012117 [Oedothorax gibbosus]|uniref:SAM domain-containing protein n=1 Tax=Oedothorax gibbosus TaxID=931172 RepID=A0AAV6UW11_9ARAC|nr:hypothetical protein JTE90_012117 [Oedothorax gibbosus]
MSFMDCDRFHKAARDGYLDLLQDANRKELNSRDEDGMTPAMWASYYGHLDALRLIVGRGGDPDKCDHYGNTCLHCASGNGHTDCVSFLVNFGVNLWALDNDFHSAKDVAVLNRRDDCLRLLDHAQSKHALVNKKLVQRLKEKSVYDAEKRVKNYRKLQQKAAKRAEKEEKERRLGDKNRKDAKSNGAPKFSEIVNNCPPKEPLAKRFSNSSSTLTTRTKKSVVFLTGDVIRRHDEDGTSSPDTQHSSRSDSTHSSSDDAGSDVLHATDSGIGDDLQETSSSSPPSFGGIFTAQSALRHSSLKDSIGSAGSLMARRHITWEDEYELDDADDDATDDSEDDGDVQEDDDRDAGDANPLSFLLAAIGLSEYLPLLECERIDLEALSLLTEDDLKTLGMPLGPRRKLGRALKERLEKIKEPGAVLDSPLTQGKCLKDPGPRERIDLEALPLLTEDDLKTLGPRRKLGQALKERLDKIKDTEAVLDSPL